MTISFAKNLPRSIYHLVVRNWSAPDSLFGKVDVRKHYSPDEAWDVFNRVWDEGLGAAVTDAPVSGYETIREQLSDQERVYLRQDYEHRTVRYRGLTFVAQLAMVGQDHQLDQLWFIHSHDKDNIIVCVSFKTQEERERFHQIAKQLGYQDGQALLQNYTNKLLNEE